MDTSKSNRCANWRECSSTLRRARDRLAVTVFRELTRQLPAATLPENVDDPSANPRRRPGPPGRSAATDPSGGPDKPEPSESSQDSAGGAEHGRPDFTGFSIVGLSRRRVGWVSAAFLAVWIVIVFTRQVGDAQAAANRATELAADNPALAAEVASLQRERDLIVRPEYVGQEARGYRFGSPKEVPFSLDPSVAAPVDGAPGSASVRLGA